MVSSVVSSGAEFALPTAPLAEPEEPVPADEDSLSSTLREWEAPINRIASRYTERRSDLDDLVQAGRLAVCRAIANFDRSFPSPFAHYAKRSIRFAVIREAKRLSRQRRREKSSIEDNPQAIDRLVCAGAQPSRGAVAQLLEWIDSLPDRLRELYRLLYVEGLTQRAAAEILDASQPRIAQLHRALLREGATVLVQ
jgi:RNA polymerase sigma factor (sigma-70 family)